MTMAVLLLVAGLQPVGSSRDAVICSGGLPTSYTLPSRQERIEWARALAAPFLRLQQDVPSLTPREQDWLKAESNAGGTRALKATFSTIGRQQTLLSLVRDIVDDLLLLGAGVGRESSEVAIWANVVALLAEPELSASLEQLANEKVVPDALAGAHLGMERREFLQFTCTSQALRIQNWIVVPFLRR